MNDRKQFRRGRFARWGSAGVLAALAVAWALSYRVEVTVTTGNWSRGVRLDVAVLEGALVAQPWKGLGVAAWPGVEATRVTQDKFEGIGSPMWFGHFRSWVVGSVWWAPMWAVCGVAAAGAWWAWRRAWAEGLCGECGYDVRGLTSAECPECGATLLPPCGSSTSQPG